MASLDEIRNTRLQKLNLLKEKGIDPYPIESHIQYSLKEVGEQFDALSAEAKDITVGGRIMSLREQGAVIFIDLFDGTARFQVLVHKDKLLEEQFDLFTKTVDIGDFIEVTGMLFVTKRGQQTVEAHSWTMLAKSLRPLPEKWHGLQDVEERFRRRYLDTVMDEEIRKRFILRSRMVSELRKIFDGENYLEVETPILQSVAGGASAEPFITHHNALDIDLSLRIAPELYLKELVLGGFPRVYEIGRLFRNEGIDVTHNPEFTTVEWYAAFSDAPKQMAFTEQIFKTLVRNLKTDTTVEFEGEKIDFEKAFDVVSYAELLKNAGVDIHSSKQEVEVAALKNGVKIAPGDSVSKILDNIYKKVCRPKIIQPTFIIEYPVDYLPLAKKSEKDPRFVDAFQLVVAGLEIVKAFSELNDPIDQKERFEMQEKNKSGGDKEAQPMDMDYVEAMEYGMPPMGGAAISIDRTTMILTNSRNIREVILFPTLKPKN